MRRIRRNLPYLLVIAVMVVAPLILLEVLVDDRVEQSERASPNAAAPEAPGRQAREERQPKPSTAARRPSGGQATTLEILSPKPGAMVKGSQVKVRLKLNGKLASADQVRRRERRGDLVHVHALLDEGRWDTPEHSSSKLFKAERQGGYSALTSDVLVYRNIPPGEHRLRIELVHNDHQPPSGVAGAQLVFSVVE